MTRTLGTAVGACLLVLGLNACGHSANGARDESSAKGDAGATDAPSPTRDAEADPKTEVTQCKVENGLPVASVKVTNTTSRANTFAVEVQFAMGDTVLGTGLELTEKLEPKQNQTISMGNMQGNARAVDRCKVIDVSAE